MPTVIEYEPTREQVIQFRAEVERVTESFDQSHPQAVPSSESRELLAALLAKWRAERHSKGRQMVSSGLYGALNEAIVRLPGLNTPRSDWYSALYDALTTAPRPK